MCQSCGQLMKARHLVIVNNHLYQMPTRQQINMIKLWQMTEGQMFINYKDLCTRETHHVHQVLVKWKVNGQFSIYHKFDN